MPKTMKAAVLHGIDDLRYEDVPVPELGDHDVLVKIKACGICGSDLPRVLKTGTYHFPTIPGHEFGGEVVELGKDVNPEYLHKNVAVIPLIPCHHCKPCEVGDYAQCEHYDFLGSRNDGGFAEYVKVPDTNLVFVPDGLDPEAAAFLEPISVALHVVSNNNVTFGEDVAVYGLGAIGMFVAQWAKAYGARVFAIDLDESKVEIAKSLGMKDAICSSKEDAVAIIKEKTNGEGVDAVFEAAGSGFVFNQAFEILKNKGRLGCVGRPVGDLTVTNKSFEAMLRKQITVKGTWSFEFKSFPHNAWDIALAALRDGTIQVAPIVSHRIPLRDTYKGIRIMADKTEPFFKILVEPELD